MLSSIQKSPETHDGHGLALATLVTVGAALTLDQFIGTHDNSHREANPEFHFIDNNAEMTVAVLPGCQSDGRMLLKELQPQLHNANIIMTDYPKHGFNLEAVCEGLAKVIIEERAYRTAILGISMGGMVTRHFLHYAEQTGLAEQIGGFSNIVLDSSPYDARDIKFGYRFLLGAAKAGQSSWTADYLKQLSLARKDSSIKNAHISAIHGQGKFMHSRHPRGPLPDIFDRLTYIQGPDDHVINTQVAAGKYLADSPQPKSHYFIDNDRPDHSHTAEAPHYPYLLSHLGIRSPAPDYNLAIAA